MSGIAAILRFPVPDLADEDGEEAAGVPLPDADVRELDLAPLADALADVPASGRQSPDLYDS